MDTDDPRSVSGGHDKMFSESVFLWVSSEQTDRRDKVSGSGGRTADLSPHGCVLLSGRL